MAVDPDDATADQAGGAIGRDHESGAGGGVGSNVVSRPGDGGNSGVIDRWRYAYAQHPWNGGETLSHLGFDVFRYTEGRPVVTAPGTIRRYLEHRWGRANPIGVVWSVLARRIGLIG